MISNLDELPLNLPVPVDDGAASHLAGSRLPKLSLTSTDGSLVDLGRLKGRWVVYVYPMTGRPGVPLPAGWDMIPGARGCTPESCGFRDHYQELKRLTAGVFGLSSQDSAYQREARDRLKLPFELLSDCSLLLKAALGLPTLVVAGMELFRRVTLVAENGLITKVFYPVFPPDTHAEKVVSWLGSA